jgi:uncharacterized protein YegJ (DUF2314 family)
MKPPLMQPGALSPALRAVSACAIAMLIGCAREDAGDAVVTVSAADPGMNAAIDSARLTVDVFVKALAVPPGPDRRLTLKVPLRKGSDVEHVWLSEVAFDGKRFRGRVDNEIGVLKRVRVGDTLSIARDSISDWMILASGHAAGAFSVRLLRGRMTSAEREAFDRETNGAFAATSFRP